MSADRLWWMSCTNQVGETLHMTNGASRLLAAGALAVAAIAAPIAVALSSSPAQHSEAAPAACLAWIGNKDDGNCVGRSNGQPITGGTPWGIWGPSGGVSTGPLLPGQSWNTPMH